MDGPHPSDCAGHIFLVVANWTYFIRIRDDIYHRGFFSMKRFSYRVPDLARALHSRAEAPERFSDSGKICVGVVRSFVPFTSEEVLKVVPLEGQGAIVYHDGNEWNLLSYACLQLHE